VQRLSQEEGVNLSGIKRILELDRELRRHQQHLAEVTAELTQLRMELESTRAVAARLASLLRSRSGGAQLVPVHGTGRAAASPGGPPPPSGERRELPAAASRAARVDTRLNNDTDH
jgi:DNA-binding transcriptional MerR regulator